MTRADVVAASLIKSITERLIAGDATTWRRSKWVHFLCL